MKEIVDMILKNKWRKKKFKSKKLFKYLYRLY